MLMIKSSNKSVTYFTITILMVMMKMSIQISDLDGFLSCYDFPVKL